MISYKDRYITLNEVAKLLNETPWKTLEIVDKKHIASVHLGNKAKFKLSDIEDLLLNTLDQEKVNRKLRRFKK